MSGQVWVNSLITLAAAILGGLVTWGTSYYFERKRENDRNLSTAYSLMFKVQQIADQILKLNQHITQSLAQLDTSLEAAPPWTKFIDIIGFEKPFEPITSNELALVAKTKDAQLTMDVRELESSHSIVFATFNRISQLRHELGKSGHVTKVEGNAVSFEATPEQYAQLAPTLINLETSSIALVQSLPHTVERARKLASRLGLELKRHYNFDHFITFNLEETPSSD